MVQLQNYVIQFILEQGHDEDKAVIVSQIQGNLVNLAHHKYASNVCEKALICADSASREMLINEMMAISNTESPILIMAKDQYASEQPLGHISRNAILRHRFRLCSPASFNCRGWRAKGPFLQRREVHACYPPEVHDNLLQATCIK